MTSFKRCFPYLHNVSKHTVVYRNFLSAMFDERVPIIEITARSLKRLLPVLREAIRTADFIALDLELSGIGNYGGLRGKACQERYVRIRETVETRSILSMGIATFELRRVKETKKMVKLDAMLFNLLTMRSSEFTVEPQALSFLSKHGFDFNRLIDDAISYNFNHESSLLPLILKDILTSGASLIFHNGFIDCAFLYRHFFSSLPDSIGSFQSCLCDWFSVVASEKLDNGSVIGGRGLFYDNKFLAKKDGLSATFLEYVFRKHQRANVQDCLGAKVYLKVMFTRLIAPEAGDVDFVECELSPHFLRNDFAIEAEAHAKLCNQFATYGFCRIRGCDKLHEVDLLLDIECHRALKEQARRKRKLAAVIGADAVGARKQSRPMPEAVRNKLDAIENSGDETSEVSGCSGRPYERTKFSSKGCHRAGMDAFMTGFSVLYSQRMQLFKKHCLDASVANKTTMAGLDAESLPLVKSTYAPASEAHRLEWADLSDRKAKAIIDKMTPKQ